MSDVLGKVLVTGATGGLGLALVKAFRDAGHEVRATGRSTATAERIAAMGATFVRHDLATEGAASEACRGCTSVVHAAALSGTWGNRGAFETANVGITRSLLEAAREAGCDRFVFVSSPSIMATMRDQVGIVEDAPPADPPLNHYARTKLQAERMVLAADTAGFRTTAVRPRAIVGPDDGVLLPKLAAMARRGRIPLFRDGQALIELTDARDAARAILMAHGEPEATAGLALNVSGGVPVPVRVMAESLAGALGAPVRFVPVPILVAKAIARVSDWRGDLIPALGEPALTRYALATLAYSQTFDMDRARRLIGYVPRHDALATLLCAARGMAR